MQPFRPFSLLLWLSLFWIVALPGIRCAADLIPEYSVTLEWDANNEADVAGYRLYYGTTSGTYTESVDAGNVTVATVSLVPGLTYYFSVTAYNEVGLESAFSEEVTFTAPPVPELQVESMAPPAGPDASDRAVSITDPALLPGGGFSFTILAPPGQRLEIHASSDLIAWTCRGILENPTGGMVITDPDASRHRQRYYRVVEAVAVD